MLSPLCHSLFLDCRLPGKAPPETRRFNALLTAEYVQSTNKPLPMK
uniref:Uncharacterized protein n=1 Tax=Arundo donax TaxID=35708 RepID=A0A0A9C3V3_ARUDO